jgi:hypothetical protein
MKRKWLYLIPIIGMFICIYDKYETDSAIEALSFIFWQLSCTPIPFVLCMYFKIFN